LFSSTRKGICWRGRGITGNLWFPSRFGAGRNLKFQIQRRENRQKGFNLGGGIAILNQGDRFLTQPRLVTQCLLTQRPLFTGAANQIANLFWISRKVAHGPTMR
jgi:hypothetical protein